MGNMPKLVYIETLGCQMNKSDTERILGILSTLGYDETTEQDEADLLITNTCNIRQQSADKAYSHLGIWSKWKKKRNPNLKIAICGCVAQQDAKQVSCRIPNVDLIFGTHNINELPNLIERMNSGERVCSIRKEDVKTDKEYIPKRKESLNAWIPIIEGCDYFCTYCVVPYVRGRQRSREMADIIDEAKQVLKEGFKEITLLGQTVDSYGRDIDDEQVTLANLLRELNKLDGLMRIRFVTSYPTDITDDLIKAVKELDKVVKYFHLPMQSGSSEILKSMKRRYSREEYLDICGKIRAQIPEVTITSDFIVGFPGETDEQFQETMSIIDEAEIGYSNTAAYSPRKQTPAATWRDRFVDDKVKKERLIILNDKVKEASHKYNAQYIGHTFEVLVEDVKEKDGELILSGKSMNEKIAHAPLLEGMDKSIIGTLVNIKVEEALVWCVKGKIVV